MTLKGKVALIDDPEIGLMDAAMAAEAIGEMTFVDKGNMTKEEIDELMSYLISLKKQGFFRGFWVTFDESVKDPSFAGFWACVWAFDLQLSLDVWTWLAGFALAWTVGLVVPGAPGGLGVFEAVLLLRLAVALPQASLLAVALSYRLVVTLADVLTAVLVGADERLALPGRSSQ